VPSNLPVKREINESSVVKKHYPSRVIINLEENDQQLNPIPPKNLTSSYETL
jgi:uncharacterized protein Veg